MTTQILINNVRLPALIWAGTSINPTTDPTRYNNVLAAGGTFFSSAIAAIAAAAVQAGKVRAKAGRPDDAEAIMQAAAATVQRVTDVRHDVFRLPQATATVLSTTTAKAASQPKSPSAHLTCPRNVQLLTASWASTAPVAVTLSGTDVHDQPNTETIVIPTAGTTVQGNLAWLDAPTIQSWTTPAGWTAGTFQMQAGTKLGLLSPPGSSPAVVKEVAYADSSSAPANVAVGATDSGNSTYVPTSALDGATDVEVWYA